MKRILSLLLVFVTALSLCACAPSAPSETETETLTEEKIDTQINTEAGTDPQTDSTDSASEVKDMENLVIACDQAHERVVVYDLEQYDGDLDRCEVWSFTPQFPARRCLSGVKYRENTVFGDVVIIVASYGYAGIVKYPSKEVVWQTASCGYNPHSVEILPSGNLVTASSTDGILRLYCTSALLTGDKTKADTYKQYSLVGAHGALWDPESQLLWAVGGPFLNGYAVSGEGVTEELVLMNGVGGSYPQSKGHHALSADLTDKNGLFISDATLIYYDQEKNIFSTSFKGSRFFTNHADIKSFGNDAAGRYILCATDDHTGKDLPWINESFASWCTNEIYCYTPNGKGGYKADKYVSGTCAYYKALPFVGTYR